MRTLIRVSLMVVVSLLLTIAFTSQQQAMAQAEDDVIINEFSVNSNSGREYVELLVTNASGVNMQGWTLSDVATRAGATAGTEGDVTLPAAAYLANVPQGTHVVIVLTTATTAPQVLTEDTSTADGNNKLVLIVGVTAGLTTGGTMDNATADNVQLYAGTRAAGTLIDQVLVGGNSSFIAGATWGDNNGATTTDNINGSNSMPSNSIARFVPTANTLAGFQDNDTGARWVVDANSYGTPGYRNAGVRDEMAVGGSTAPPARIATFDGDTKTDVSVWRSDERNWYIIQSSNGILRTQIDWGGSALGDVAVPGDYTGDGRTDIAVWRPSEGNWYIVRSDTNQPQRINWGTFGDVPVPGDYDGDGKTDAAVFRPTEGNWYILGSTGAVSVRGFGTQTDFTAQADYDNDGRTDVAVFRPSENNWYVLRSSGGVSVTSWGTGGDKLVPADYDGDGITDIAVYRPGDGNWYIRRSSGGVLVRNWGINTDTPVPGDYDGDGLVDVAVYRPEEGNWYIFRSSDNTGQLVNLSGDHPVPNEYLP